MVLKELEGRQSRQSYHIMGSDSQESFLSETSLLMWHKKEELHTNNVLRIETSVEYKDSDMIFVSYS